LINDPIALFAKMSIFYAANRTATMHEDEGSSPDKLQAMMDVIAGSVSSSRDGHADLGRLRVDAASAATVLVEFYGDAALERASLLERRSPQSHFARMVTAELRGRGKVSRTS
jgi:hypothetical protein